MATRGPHVGSGDDVDLTSTTKTNSPAATSTALDSNAASPLAAAFAAPPNARELRDHVAQFTTRSDALGALVVAETAVGWVLTFFGIIRELSASILLYSVGSEVLSVTLLKLWANGQAEQVSVIGLMMMLLVIFFRWVQLKLIKQRISTL